jgi:nucleotide-binding universal stress UspA family protein
MKEYLESMAHSIREAGFSARTHLQIGDAPSAIVRFVEENPPQLLAMSTHGRTGLRRMIYGSVAEQVMERVKKTPMLLVSGSAKPREALSEYDVT